jgi:hypothetical protein
MITIISLVKISEDMIDFVMQGKIVFA